MPLCACIDLPVGWHVFHGLQLQEASDIDHVAVGLGGLFCISTRSSRGMYSVSADGTYLFNSRPTDHLKDVQRQTMRLRDRLEALLGKVPWVQPILAVPLAYVDFSSFQSIAWVLHQDNLSETLCEQKKKLSADEVRRIARALDMIAANAASLYRPAEAAADRSETRPVADGAVRGE